ncbi:hypothetical protein AAE478_008663 [Parahypoxylon ruwenzoriense]
MGNLLGRPRCYYVSYYRDPIPADGYCADSPRHSDYYARGDDGNDSREEEDDDEYGSCSSSDDPGPPRYLFGLSCLPMCDDRPRGETGTSWGGNVVGVARRKGCRTRDHWSLAFRPDIDASQLPPRVAGFRVQIPRELCRRTCELGQRYYVLDVGGDAYSGGGGGAYLEEQQGERREEEEQEEFSANQKTGYSVGHIKKYSGEDAIKENHDGGVGKYGI